MRTTMGPFGKRSRKGKMLLTSVLCLTLSRSYAFLTTFGTQRTRTLHPLINHSPPRTLARRSSLGNGASSLQAIADPSSIQALTEGALGITGHVLGDSVLLASAQMLLANFAGDLDDDRIVTAVIGVFGVVSVFCALVFAKSEAGATLRHSQPDVATTIADEGEAATTQSAEFSDDGIIAAAKLSSPQKDAIAARIDNIKDRIAAFQEENPTELGEEIASAQTGAKVFESHPDLPCAVAEGTLATRKEVVVSPKTATSVTKGELSAQEREEIAARIDGIKNLVASLREDNSSTGPSTKQEEAERSATLTTFPSINILDDVRAGSVAGGKSGERESARLGSSAWLPSLSGLHAQRSAGLKSPEVAEGVPARTRTQVPAESTPAVAFASAAPEDAEKGEQDGVKWTQAASAEPSRGRRGWWASAKSVAKRVASFCNPNPTYLANMVLLTGVTGGVVSAGLRPLSHSSLLQLNGRLDVKDHVVVLSDDVDTKLINVLRGISHEAERSPSSSSLRRGPVLVLTPHDRQRAQATIDGLLAEDRPQGRSPIHVIARQGDSGTVEDLSLVNVQDAKHVVWVKNDEASAHSHRAAPVRADADTRTDDEGVAESERHTAREVALLAELRGGKAQGADDGEEAGRRSAPVVVVSGREKADSALTRVGNGRDFLRIEELALSAKLLERATAQAGPGLAHGLNKLLGGGEADAGLLHSEPISEACPWLMGQEYAQAQSAFPKALVVGLIRNGDEVYLSPPPDTWLSPLDRLVCIGSSKDGLHTARMATTPSRAELTAGEALAQRASAREAKEERAQQILVLNWNERGPAVLEQLRAVATDKGAVTVMADRNTREDFGEIAGGLRAGGGRAKVALYQGNAADARHLASVRAAHSDVIVVLPDSDREGHVDGASDARLLATVQELATLEWPERDGARRPRLVGMVRSQEMEERLEEACERAGLERDLVLSDRIEGHVASKVMLQPRMQAVVAAMVEQTRLVSMADMGRANLNLNGPGRHEPVAFEGTFEQLQQQGARHGLLIMGVAKGGERSEVTLKPQASEWLSLARSDSVLALPRLDTDELCKA